MAIFSLFKARAPKQFSFQARYYDERKERIEQIKKEANGENSATTLQKGFLRARSYQRSKQSKAINLRVLLIIAVLLLLVYQLLKI